jgi:hypothetical protein
MHWIINAYEVLIGTLDESGLAGIPGHNWKGNVKTDLRNRVELYRMSYVHLARNSSPWQRTV